MAMVGGVGASAHAPPPPHRSAWPPLAAQGLYDRYGVYSLYGLPVGTAVDPPGPRRPEPGLAGPLAGLGLESSFAPPLGSSLGSPLGSPLGPVVPQGLGVHHKVPGETLFSSAFAFGGPPLGSPLGSPLPSPGSPHLAPCAPCVPPAVYQQQAGPFIDNSGAGVAGVAGAPGAPGTSQSRWDPALHPRALAVNVTLDGGAGPASSPVGPAAARRTPLQSPQSSGLLSPAGDRVDRPGSEGPPCADRACQVAEVTTSGDRREPAAVSSTSSPGALRAEQGFGLLSDPQQLVLLASHAPAVALAGQAPRPVLWSGFSPSLLLPPPPVLLSSAATSAASMTICRSVSMQTAHHSVSNVVALPSLPPPQHPLLAVASLCQQASWTAPSEQVPVIGDGESEKLVSYPPKCISDGESTVITQTADPSKQCSAGVQTQIDSDTSANGFSPACFGSPTLPGCDERERDSGLFWAGSTKEPAATQTDSQTDSRTDSPTTGPPRAERFLTPLVVEADSIGECLTSPVPQISSSNEEGSAETTIVPDKPNELDLSGLELLYKSIEHMESMETKRAPHGEALAQDDDKVLAAAPHPEPSGLGGLGLLCALAEQRIQEELEDAPRRPEPDRGAPTPTPTPRPTADVNRNYRTPQSEKDVRRYLATRAEASHASPVAVSLKLTPKNDSVEMEIQNRLAELKRAYKETQRELSRLTPRKNSTECESSCGSHNGSPHSKRVPAKSSLTRKKKAAAKKKTPHKSENSSDPPPPILERVTDVCEAPLPKLKWSRLDAPPTLTPHKPPSEHSNGQRASFKLNLVKLPATKDHKRRWSVDSPSARISTETQHADDEDSDGLWPEFSSKHFEARHRRNKGPSDTSSLYSSSKRRKVGRPKRHLDKAGNGYHATETIVPKQPKNKANLVSFLLASKSAGAPGKFPSNEHRPSENSCSSPEHRPKIRPKLKAEVKVKETWEDEDILDWSTPKPQLPSHPLRPLDLVFECMEEISSNGHEKSLDLKHRVGDEDDIGDAEWLPSPKKAKMPATLLKPIVVPSFIQSKISEKTLPIVKPRRPANVAKERRQSTEKLHLKKPVCSSSEELMPAKVSCDPESCILTAEILDSAGLPIRTLTAQGGLFYAGLLNAVTPPDLYSIALHGERASRLNIYSREEILQDTILEVRPLNVETLHIGTRLCAYWSQQTRCLYPGVVVPPSTPDPTLDGDFVTVEFDDGDSGQIRIQDIRLLPPNYPVVEFDPNPLLSLTKRRRRNSEKSSDSKDRRVSADSALSPSTSNHENQKEDDVKNLSQAESSDNLADAKQPFELSAPSTFRNSPSPYKRRLSTQLIENESKRLKKRRRDKLKRLMTASAAADARKHKHKHKHKHRHRRSSSGSSSDAVSQTEMDVHLPLEEKNRSDPIQEPLSPISGKGEIKQLKEEEEEEKEVLKEEGKKDEYVSKEEELQEDVKMESCDPQTTIKESQPTDLPKSEDTSILANESQSQGKRPKKKHDRQNSTETSKMAAFLPPRQLWDWSGKGYKRQGGKGRKKEFYKCIQRGSEQITVGDCAVFLSTNSPDRPYIGRIESLWEIYNGMMVVRVKWFYHPEETEGCPSLKYPGGLFQSDHADDNDVQTISHRCEVLSISDYEKRVNQSPGHLSQIQDVYYLAGFYDPKNILIKMEKGVPV